jgi:glutamate synthase (NADPH/NADH) small chain
MSRQEAVVEADRCLECGGPYAGAPCVAACPADVDVPTFVRALAEDDPARAARTIFADNLLGATCARVCPVEVLCQGACVLLHEGQKPVDVARLQRYACDWALAHGPPLRERAHPTGRSVAVVGAGPAGLVCAGELAARGHRVVVFDERAEVGGLARYAIAPYRIECEPLPDEAKRLEELGVEFRLGEGVAGADAFRRLQDDFDAVFLGIGMGEDADVSYPGDGLQGVWKSLPFIEALKLGRLDDVPGRVVVVGGGNTAVDVAREALRLGAESVTLVYRRTEEEMPAYAHEVAEAREEGVRLELLATPLRFVGDRWLEGVVCQRMQLGAADASGRRRPEPIPTSEFLLPADTAVLAIGQRPRAGFVACVDGLALDDARLSVEPDTGRTGNPKVYAAGDAVTGGATVVEAVAGAKRAARAIDAALREEER